MNATLRALGCLAVLLGASPALATDRVSVGDRQYHRSEFRASTFSPSAQSAAALDIDAHGNLIVVWSSRRQQEGQYGVYGQRFSPAGVALGGETQVNLWTRSHQMAPDIATDGDGNTWVVWQSHGQDGHAGAIVARRFDGEFRGGSEILVNQQWRGHQTGPIVVTGPGGQALFVWGSVEAGGAPQVLRARLFGGDGPPRGPEFAVRGDRQTSARAAGAAFAPDGRFVIVYSVFDASRHPAGIYLQRFAADCTRLGEELLVSGPTRDSQIEPTVCAHRNGYLVCWLDAESDGDDYGVLARRIDFEGRPRGAPFVVNTTRHGPQTAAAVAHAHDGRFAIAWNSSDGDDSGVFAQLFSVDGATLGSEFRINRHHKGKQALRGAVSTKRLILNPSGELICAWSGDAGLGDESSANVTLLTPQPLQPAGTPQGVTDNMRPAVLTAPASTAGTQPSRPNPQSSLASATPHRPPTFDPADIDTGEREIRGDRGDFGFTAVVNTGWTPPDPHLAVGPEHVVVMTNGAIAFFTKDGNLTFQDEIEDSFGFWGSVGASGFVFDPEVLYDPLSGRFFAMASEAYAPPDGLRSFVLVAVSDDSNPNGTWYKYRLSTTALAGYLFDSPNIGVDQDAVYITGDGFGITSNYPIYIFDKASLLAGTPPAVANSLTLQTTTQSAGIPPVTNDAGLLYMIEHGEGGPGKAAVRLIALRDGLTLPDIVTTSLSVPPYSAPEDPPQAGTSIRPETFDARFWSVAFADGSLWATHHVDSNRVRVRWYQIAMNGWPASGQQPQLIQSGEIDPGGDVRTFFGSITVDDLGNAAMTFARSSPAEYISMRTAYRLACDPLGTFRTGVTQYASTAPDTSGRWGDYSEIEPDPVAPRSFWAHHEYTVGSWRTWVSRIDVEPCGPPGDLDGDGDVDLADLALLLASYGVDDGGDLDGDGDTDLADLAILLSNYGS
jgi:hypothetical protein